MSSIVNSVDNTKDTIPNVRYLKIDGVCLILQTSRTTLWRIERDRQNNGFPLRRRFGNRFVYLEHEIKEWKANIATLDQNQEANDNNAA